MKDIEPTPAFADFANNFIFNKPILPPGYEAIMTVAKSTVWLVLIDIVVYVVTLAASGKPLNPAVDMAALLPQIAYVLIRSALAVVAVPGSPLGPLVAQAKAARTTDIAQVVADVPPPSGGSL